MNVDDADLIRAVPYLVELDRQCTTALSVARAMSGITIDLAMPDPQAEQTLFDNAERILHAAAIIGWILYAASDDKRTRAQFLRKALQLPDKSTLSNWQARNKVVHLDEVIDEWVENNQEATQYLHTMITNHGRKITETSVRRYDVGTNELYIWGKKADLPHLVSEIKNVHDQIAGFFEELRSRPTI